MKTENPVTYVAYPLGRSRAQRLAETREELRQLRGANAQSFAASIGITPDLFDSYLRTMEAQERVLVREIAAGNK